MQRHCPQHWLQPEVVGRRVHPRVGSDAPRRAGVQPWPCTRMSSHVNSVTPATGRRGRLRALLDARPARRAPTRGVDARGHHRERICWTCVSLLQGEATSALLLTCDRSPTPNTGAYVARGSRQELQLAILALLPSIRDAPNRVRRARRRCGCTRRNGTTGSCRYWSKNYRRPVGPDALDRVHPFYDPDRQPAGLRQSWWRKNVGTNCGTRHPIDNQRVVLPA